MNEITPKTVLVENDAIFNLEVLTSAARQINVGRDYLPALELLRFPPQTQFAAGGIGERKGKLKEWLLAV